ncbi:hypothetical protein GUJ93_ZPchr0011g28566 [Zizania palustris]|uniref:Uncharacterized protein n=1 Tax=Zizania palustris TaxID=103762 RepID=A0A8J5WF85_ZIZPA|nr:hypothetical protein GUJ93_ZPchr0011g28566 [Zizania palustris]
MAGARGRYSRNKSISRALTRSWSATSDARRSGPRRSRGERASAESPLVVLPAGTGAAPTLDPPPTSSYTQHRYPTRLPPLCSPSPVAAPSAATQEAAAQVPVETIIERVIFDFRFLALLAVVESLAGSLLCFLNDCVYIKDAYNVYWTSCVKGVRQTVLKVVETISEICLSRWNSHANLWDGFVWVVHQQYFY